MASANGHADVVHLLLEHSAVNNVPHRTFPPRNMFERSMLKESPSCILQQSVKLHTCLRKLQFMMLVVSQPAPVYRRLLRLAFVS